MHDHDGSAAQERQERHAKKETVIALNGIPKPSHVAEYRSQHGASAEYTAGPFVAPGEQTYGREQFPNSLPPSPPGFGAHPFENVNGFLRAGELKEQGLDHDAGSDEAANPTYRQLGTRQSFGVFDLVGGKCDEFSRGWVPSLEMFEFFEMARAVH